MPRHFNAQQYNFKLIGITVFFALLFVAIATRLALLQIYQKDFFSKLAKNQYTVSLKLDSPRALIYDRTGHYPFALNEEASSAFIIPQQLTQPKKIKRFLARHYKTVYQRLLEKPHKHFLWIERKMSPEKKAYIEQQHLDDIQWISETRRSYPCRECAHIIGFSDIDNHGLAGLELFFQEQLAGEPEHITIERDARRTTSYFNKTIVKPGLEGKPVITSIDHTLQFIAQEELEKLITYHEAKSGSAIIMNPDTGEILAMVNYPTFDPNQKSINNIEATKNYAVTDCFECGSVIKIFCALAAYEERVATPDEIIDCKGKSAIIDGFKVENWKSVGELPFKEVIKNSSNVGVALIAKRLGQKYYHHLRKLGFGSKTGIEFPGERAGFVNPPEKWSKSSVLVLSFGYEIMASILQIAKALSIIANGGYAINPTLRAQTNKQIGEKLYSDQAINDTKNTLELIGQKYPVPGCRIMAKTGTARCVKDGQYSKKSHVYTFGGIVEQGDYKRVIITFVQEPSQSNLWATGVAGPIFHNIAKKMVLYEKILCYDPDNEQKN